MKTAFFTLVLLLSVSLVSCEKEQVSAPNAPASNVSVEYRIGGESGHLSVEYIVSENGMMVTKTETIDRTSKSFNFEVKPGHFLSVKAHNTTPSAKEVRAEIYVNGVLFQSATANAPGAVAAAEGTY